ncbi:isoleucine--tRNA ligase [Miniphocaeibacter massiliensis]|uniref:isoleucine--tRNA ligase n=1 Tax=Miniphocaeibacter massiliensis TaxID=2041841 RepID=UPI000C1C5606|nr:isoleucine--tRNA ligase [Miniphocaeibacter massiliensis]
MAKFKDLSKLPVKEREIEISKYWKDIDLLHETVNQRLEDKNYIFYDGPPTANGKPGIHHVISRTLKDMNCRYKTMKGYRVKKKAGWDTHGLPVEIEVEKRLGLKSKKEIEEYGVEAFNKECKNSVFTYEQAWREMSDRMAFMADMDNPYITLDNNYIETVWWLLDQMFKKGLVYEGAKILPYCPRCGTGLASHEVAQGYKMIKTQTVYVAFKRKDSDEYFLAWTTTPWTLLSNVALTVGADIDYILAELDGNKYYIAKDLADKVLGEDYRVLKELKGKDMEYMEYEQLLPFFTVDKKAFFVTTADYVSTSDGTGIVHTAPAFGEDDYQTGRRYNLPLINPVNEEGKFIGSPWDGQNVMEADHDIIHYLFDHGKAFKKQKIEHNYPHCWRCGTPLIYYSKPSWYIEVTKLKEQFIDENNKVNWYPDFIGEKRFGNWLENLNDWAITRSRYWGTPFPVWKCECGHTDSVGSRKELKERAIEEISEDIELHRPYVDDVHLKCEKCGKTMTREKDVIDVWFDSGAMPFAQQHYPFENKENFFDEMFPADFINEGIDQTRGWFYSLLAISVLITGKAPYKNVLVNDLILDKEGKKMSKSRGNTLNPIELFDKYGADVVRFYSLYVSPPWVPTKFDTDGLREVDSKFFRSFKNTYNFFQLYANTDEIDPRDFYIDPKDRPEIDRWILSRFNNLVKLYNESMEIFEVTKVVRAISDFVIEDVSNWYIRRNRRRFWKTEIDDDKKAVYNTTYEILLGVAKLVAPFTPFMAEEIYRNLTDKASVHLDYIPELEESLIDEKLEEKMEVVRNLVALGRASREEVNIKVRQPLKEIVVDAKYEDLVGDLIPLIKEELNIKNVKFEADLSEFMNYELKPDFKVAGRILGKNIKEFQNYLKDIDAKAFVAELEEADKKITLGGEKVEIKREYIDVRVSAKEGFDVIMENNLFVILDTTITPELKAEGYAREFISKVQQMRKANDYDVLDNIKITYVPTEAIKEAVTEYENFIKDETLAVEIIAVDSLDSETVDLNGEEVVIKLERV